MLSQFLVKNEKNHDLKKIKKIGFFKFKLDFLNLN